MPAVTAFAATACSHTTTTTTTLALFLSVWPKHHASSGTTSTVSSFHTQHSAAERKPSNWFCLWNNCVCVRVRVRVRACGQPPWLSVSLSVNSSGLHVVCERAFCTT